MSKVFRSEEHFFNKACIKAGITFPCTKAEALEKAGDITVRTDFEEYTPLKTMIECMKPESYINSFAWQNAYMAAAMHILKEKTGY